jgi:adenylate cyclase
VEAELEAALERARRGGQVVGVVAEPGVGKSRLCREFADRCRQRGMRVTVGGGLAHGPRVPLLPLIEMLRAYFGITADDDPRAARAKVTAPLVNEDFGELLPVLFEFLGVPDPERPVPAQMAPEARQRALLAAMRRLFEAAGEEGPGLLVLEDLHWLDSGSDAFLANLVESLPGASTLLVVNFRPEYQADWMRRSYYEQLPLATLERDQTARLVEALAGRDPSLNGLAELIAERTGGNPFFIEEVVQGLVDNGGLEGARGDYRLARAIHEIQIPASVQALLSARIDQLPQREKAVLQRAAVIGRDFSEPILRCVTGHSEDELAAILHALADAELVYQLEAYPEARYAFKHPLTHEVAYRSQLREPRARAHAVVARALEGVDSKRHGELAAVISDHWEHADEPLLAAQWRARAAAWEFSVSQPEALRSWRRVRALVSDAPGSPEAEELERTASLWTLHLGGRLGLDEAEAALTFRKVRDWAEATGDETALALALAAYGFALAMAGRLLEGLALKEEAQRLAERLGNLDLLVTVGPRLLLVIAGRNRQAITDFDRLLAIAGDDYRLGRELAGHSGVIFLTFARGSALLELGRLREARLELEKAVRLAREHDDIETLGFATCQFGYLSFLTGEPGEGLVRAREAAEISERIGNRVWRALARAQVGLAHLAREEYEQAVMLGEEAHAMTRATHGGLQWGGIIHALLALGHLGLGNVARAHAAAAAGVATAAEVGSRVHEATCHGVLGRALTLQDRPADARAELERALELAGEDGPVIVPHVKLTLADLAALDDNSTERLHQLEEARKLFEHQGATGHARRTAAEIATAPSQSPGRGRRS